MGVLLDSSWMKFGPAERDSLEWSPGPPPPTERLPVSTAPYNRPTALILFSYRRPTVLLP